MVLFGIELNYHQIILTVLLLLLCIKSTINCACDLYFCLYAAYSMLFSRLVCALARCFSFILNINFILSCFCRSYLNLVCIVKQNHFMLCRVFQLQTCKPYSSLGTMLNWTIKVAIKDNVLFQFGIFCELYRLCCSMIILAVKWDICTMLVSIIIVLGQLRATFLSV